MSIKYREEYDRIIMLAIAEARGLTSGDGKKEEHIAKANMYANIANALSCMVHTSTESTAVKVENKTEETKQKPVTKEDLKPAPHVVGSEDSPETAIVEEPVKKQDANKIGEEIMKIKEIIETLGDASKHRDNYSVPMAIIMHWASQVVGTEIKNLNELNDHLDKLPELTEYFTKLNFVFNTIGATLKDAEDALKIGTQGRWTKIQDMSPDNISSGVIEVFKKYLEKRKQQMAES